MVKFYNVLMWLSTYMGVDYVVIGFDMEVQPLKLPTMQLDLSV